MGRTDRTNWKQVDALSDETIARAVADDPDAAPLEARGLRPTKRGRPPQAVRKEAISIRLSPDVLAAFRATGKGWQTRIDHALREWLKEHAETGRKSGPA